MIYKACELIMTVLCAHREIKEGNNMLLLKPCTHGVRDQAREHD